MRATFALLSAFSVVNLFVIQPSQAEPYGLPEAELEYLAALSEEEIDLGAVALFLASDIFPNLDLPQYAAQLDRMAEEIRQLTGGSRDPDYRIRAMNTYLYLDEGFHYDQDDLYANQLKNRYLNGILDTKSGSCTTMPLLYLALAHRLGYPVYPVAAPQHLFCRYVDPKLAMQNIEATGDGGSPTDADYIEDMEIPAHGITSGAYLETMTYRQLLGDLIAENGSYWANHGQLHRAIRYYSLALRLNPKAAEVYGLLGKASQQLAHQVSQVEAALEPLGNQSNAPFLRRVHRLQAQEYQRASDQALKTARALGIAPPTPANYWVRQAQIAQARALRQTAKEGP